MTPQEWEAIYLLLETIGAASYRMGFQDAVSGETARDENHFRLQPMHRLAIRTMMEKKLREDLDKH